MPEDFSSIQKKIQEFQRGLEGLNNQINQKEAEKKQLEDRQKANEAEIRKLQTDNQTARNQLTMINAELGRLKPKRQQIERQKPQLEQTLRKFTPGRR